MKVNVGVQKQKVSLNIPHVDSRGLTAQVIATLNKNKNATLVLAPIFHELNSKI